MSLGLGSVRDSHMDWKLKRVFIPATAYISAQTSGASTTLTTSGSGAPILSELGSSGIVAVRFAATTDEADFLWKVPYDYDNRHRLLIRHYWTSDYGTASGTATFTTLYTALAANSALTVGATALTKTHGASTKTSATARVPYWTSWGYIAPLATGSSANQTFAVATEFVTFDVTVSAVSGITIGSDYVYLIGTELAYTPCKTYGGGSRREGRKMVDTLNQTEEGASSDY